MDPPIYEQRSLLPDLVAPYLLPAWEPLRPSTKFTAMSTTKPRSPYSHRYVRPGQASGWLEARVGNKKRKTPTTSYFYCFDSREAGQRKRTRIYVPVSRVSQVVAMVEDGYPIPAIVQFIQQAKPTTACSTKTLKA